MVVAAAFLILLLRTRAARKAAQAAHTASGQGSILVDRKGRVLETNGPARSLLWPNHGPRDPVVLSEPIRLLFSDSSEQHHLVKLGEDHLIEIAISAAKAAHPFYGASERSRSAT